MAKQRYVTNDEILKELNIYWKTGKITTELVLIVYKIGRKIVNSRNFFLYTNKDDMLQEGVLHAITKGIPGFDEGRDNPFSYLSTVITRKYIEYIKKYKKVEIIQKQATQKLKEEMIDNIKHRV
jgi:DNA-directed RNA polymerase specialized sigma24 family protein